MSKASRLSSPSSRRYGLTKACAATVWKMTKRTWRDGRKEPKGTQPRKLRWLTFNRLHFGGAWNPFTTGGESRRRRDSLYNPHLCKSVNGFAKVWSITSPIGAGHLPEGRCYQERSPSIWQRHRAQKS